MLSWLTSVSKWIEILGWLVWSMWSVLFRAVGQFAQPIVEGIAGLIPATSYVEPTAAVLGYMNLGNYWLPLSECLTMLLAYWTFVGLFSAGKMLLKLIPMVG